MEIKQLDLSGGQEFMCIQKERVGGFVHFYVRKINSEEIGCLGVWVGKLPSELYHASSGEESPFFSVPVVHEENPLRQIILSMRTTAAHNNHNASSIPPPLHLWAEDALQSTVAAILSHLIIMTTPGCRQGEYYYQPFTHEDAQLWRMEGAFSRITELVSGTFVARAQYFTEKHCHVNRWYPVPIPKIPAVETSQSSLFLGSLEQGPWRTAILITFQRYTEYKLASSLALICW